MNFIDLNKQQQLIKKEIMNSIERVLEHGQYIQGPEVTTLENQLAQFVGIQHCIAVSSGTDALLLALMALDIQPEDEVIVPSFTFVATIEVICLLGAQPVFVDIHSDTYNIDETQIESSISSKTKAIIPVSLFGQCPRLDTINQIAKKHHIPVIEDAAQSFGATYQHQKSCSLTTIATTSFFPAKPLGCYGDGGACFTNNDDLAKKIRSLLNHGQSQKYTYRYIGINGRLDTIQAAILLEKLKIFSNEIKLKNKCAEYYNLRLKNYIQTPVILENSISVFAQYTLQTKNRDALIKKLQDKNIPVAIYYPIPLHLQEVYKKYSHKSLPITERLAKEVLSLPMHPYLTKEEQDLVIEVILNFFNETL